MTYVALPALPAEQQDPTINPSGGPLGWVVVRARDESIVQFGDRYADEGQAVDFADMLNIRARERAR